MMVMTAKFSFKKILMILGAVAAVVLSLILLMGGSQEPPQTQGAACAGNPQRIAFLKDKGWEVSEEPTESGRIRMPKEVSPVYERYNNLQKSQGFDLTDYAGKKAMRYVYQVKNYPGATAPVYATLLIYEDQIIGGDITDTAAGGRIRGLQRTSKKEVPAPKIQEKPEEAPAVPKQDLH